MDKRKEGKPGEARAALRRSVRENGCVFCYLVFFLLDFLFFHYLSLQDYLISMFWSWHFWVMCA